MFNNFTTKSQDAKPQSFSLRVFETSCLCGQKAGYKLGCKFENIFEQAVSLGVTKHQAVAFMLKYIK